MVPGGLDQAIILHCRPYRESSLFVDVLTRDHGRLRLLSRGARRGRHPLSRILRPFNRIRLSWTERGELPVLTLAESLGSGAELRGSAMYCGFYLCELLICLQPLHDPHPGLYALCEATLARLESTDDVERTLRRFEIAFLEEIGYGLRLEEDVEGQAIQSDRRYAYDPEHGASETTAASVGGCQGATLLALRRGLLEDDIQLREAKHLLRSVLAHHLNGRTLKSRELFKPLSGRINHES
jgi:DNA repair protein RecO (recombination protein O)